MDRYILLSNKGWHNKLLEKLKKRFLESEWILIQNEESFTKEEISKKKPKKIFIPHWSNKISEEIYSNYECVLFHMTDLPYGRGGSPLQNLILRGHKKTKISAIKVVGGLDEGPVYLKNDLDLLGTAKEIFLISSEVIFEMICEIIEKNPILRPQEGQPVIFKRRKPDESRISKLNEIDKIYDYIRMLDCEGYPNAYIELNGIKYEFRNVKKTHNNLEANVRIKYT